MQDIVKFILLLLFEIPAVSISIIILIYFITHPVARSKPKNHVWFIILIINCLQLIIDLPMPMSFYYIGRVWPATNFYCVWWTWYEYALNACSLVLMAWASFERHFFVFYPRLLLGGQWKKWIFHFGPILLCILWPSLWYIALVVITPNCINLWDFNQIICGIPCFQTTNDKMFGILDTMFNILIPLSIIILSNLILISRVIYEKIARHQAIHWRRHRKMSFQLWLISSLYLIGWLPFTCTQLIQITIMPTFLVDQLETIFFLLYLIPLLLPIVCLLAIPEILIKTRDRIRRRRRRNQIVAIRVIQTQV